MVKKEKELQLMRYEGKKERTEQNDFSPVYP